MISHAPGAGKVERPRTVLHVITTINRGGAENHLASLVQGQLASGWSVSVAYLKGNGYWTRQFESWGVRVFPLGLRWNGQLGPALRLRRIMAEVEPDVVHAHLPPAEFYARLALLGTSPRPAFLISKHADERLHIGTSWKYIGRWVARRAQKVIGISDAVSDFLKSHLPVPPGRVVTVHYAIDPAPYLSVTESDSSRVRAQLGCREGEWMIGTVARLVPVKALDLLLRAYARYRQQAKRPSRLAIVGDGPLAPDLQALTRDLALEPHVTWAGFREDIPRVVSAFDAFALTSKSEGFGLVLLEAMAARKPVMATRVGSIPEVVEEGKTGLLVDSGSEEQLAAGMLRLEEDGIRRTFGDRGFERAIGQFTMSRMVERTLALYHDALVETSISRNGGS